VIRLVSLACALVVASGNSAHWCAGQDAKNADAKKSLPAAKAGATERPAAPQAARVFSPAELGGTREAYAEITLVPTGRPLLAIHYPWKAHARPSVEIRWLDDNEADTAELRPLQFVASLMKGEITSAVYDCRDKAGQTPVKTSLKIQGRDVELLGDRTLVGKPAATIVFPERPKDPVEESGSDTDRAARAVFFPLDGWSVDARTLWLELPAAHFAQRGRIRVWFYREGNLVWWKTLVWPGTK
jgi:hypothetical protein